MFIYQQTEVNNHPISLGVICGQHIESSSLFGFLDSKSEAIQIPHDIGMTLFSTLTDISSPPGIEPLYGYNDINIFTFMPVC